MGCKPGKHLPSALGTPGWQWGRAESRKTTDLSSGVRGRCLSRLWEPLPTPRRDPGVHHGVQAQSGGRGGVPARVCSCHRPRQVILLPLTPPLPGRHYPPLDHSPPQRFSRPSSSFPGVWRKGSSDTATSTLRERLENRRSAVLVGQESETQVEDWEHWFGEGHWSSLPAGGSAALRLAFLTPAQGFVRIRERSGSTCINDEALNPQPSVLNPRISAQICPLPTTSSSPASMLLPNRAGFRGNRGQPPLWRGGNPSSAGRSHCQGLAQRNEPRAAPGPLSASRAPGGSRRHGRFRSTAPARGSVPSSLEKEEGPQTQLPPLRNDSV